jgi:hypothetical protein
MVSHVYVLSAPGNLSPSVFSPGMTGSASSSAIILLYISSMSRVSSTASSFVAWAVCPSCHRNSEVRRKSLGLFSQRITLHHWLISIGRSRHDCTHLLYICPITVSEVGLTIRGSSSSSPPAWVTTAHSGAKPSTCSASFSRNDFGIKSGKEALTWPVSLKASSKCFWIISHIE